MPLPKTYLIILLKILEKLLSLTINDINITNRQGLRLENYNQSHVADRKVVYIIFEVCQAVTKELRTRNDMSEQELEYLKEVDR